MIIGHQKIIEFLNKSIKNNRLAHAYLFSGQEHLGKRAVALEFVKTLQCEWNRAAGILPSGRSAFGGSPPIPQAPYSNCTGKSVRQDASRGKGHHLNFCGKCVSCQEIEKNSHPDVLVIEPEIVEEKGKKKEREIGIEKVRDMQRQIGLFAFRGPYKIIIIDQADKMTRQAANALLKILEEPTPKTIFILISSAPQSFLPTVMSRCLAIKFFPVSGKEISRRLSSEYPKKNLELAVKISAGKPGLAINYLENPEMAGAQGKIIQELTGLFGKEINSKFKYAENLSKDSALAQTTLNAWLIFFRDILLLKIGCPELAILGSEAGKKESGLAERINANQVKSIIKKIISAKQILANPSFNARLALEVLMLNI